MAARVDRVVTSGTFSLDGEDFAVDNNIWLVGDDDEVLVIDAAHQAAPIIDAVAGRRVVAILCTHGHNDHINVAAEVADAVGAPIWLHPADTMLWEVVNPDRPADGPLADGQEVAVGGTVLRVLHTPGHSPGGCCVHDATGAVPFSGSIEWSKGTDEMGLPTLIGKASIPARNLSVDVLIRKNSDTSLPASHLMEINFTVSETFIGGSIAGLPGVLLKNGIKHHGV